MKRTTQFTFCGTFIAATLAMLVGSVNADIFGHWQFDDAGDLGKATVGADLLFEGASPSHSASLADDGANSLTGVITTVVGGDNRIRADHGIAANGGGSFVNQYTIVADVFSPAGSRSSWRTLYQTNTSNSNDGEYFIRPDNDNLGSAEMSYVGPIDDTAWTRLVVTVDLTQAGTDFVTYLNGTAVATNHTGDGSVDGRYSLDPFMYVFTDNDGDDAALNVGELAIFNTALTAGEVAALGVAGATIAVPEPTSLLLMMGGLGLVGLRRRR